jgi:transcriptional regulator with XRE-family HTH domain
MDPKDVHRGGGRIDPTIGERVMLIRRRRGISQRALAAQAQMSTTALNRLERGLQSVWAERLATLARLLDVSADYLLGLQHEAHVAPRAARRPRSPRAAKRPKPPTPSKPPVQSLRTRKAAPVS